VFAEESFAVRLNRKIFTFYRKNLAVGSFESILRNKPLWLMIFKCHFSKLVGRFLQLKGVIMVKVKKNYFFLKFCGKNFCGW